MFSLLNLRYRDNSSSEKQKVSKTHMNVNKLLGDEDVEKVIMAGDAHEDNQTVIDEIFIR